MKQNKQLHYPLDELSISLPKGLTINKMLVSKGGEYIQSYLKHEIGRKKEKLDSGPELVIHNEQKVSMEMDHFLFEVFGYIPFNFGELYICLHISEKSGSWKYRSKIDLYDFLKLEELCSYMHEHYLINPGTLEKALLTLTKLLEKHRDNIYHGYVNNNYLSKKRQYELNPLQERNAIDFLQKKDLLQHINALIGKSGIVGEEKTRMAMFIIASSYKMPYPLHCLIQGVSGGGKSHLINGIATTMPQEDVLDMTRITPKSMYNFSERDLLNKVFVIQDFDGVDQEAQLAFRELQSLGYINSLYSKKDRYGNHLALIHKVKAHFSSMVATTRSQLYYDTLSRSIVLGIDESEEQTDRIIKAQNMQFTCTKNEYDEELSAVLLRNIIRVLKSYNVINPFANFIKLPFETRMKRRLNKQFQSFIAQITILHQFQRKVDEQNRLVTTLEDINLAIKYFMAPVIFKVDELDSSSRQFFEQLKRYVKQKGQKHEFTQREVRSVMSLAKTRVAQYFKLLVQMEYIQVVEGSVNRGYKYKVTYWDDLEKFKKNIQDKLYSQLENCTN